MENKLRNLYALQLVDSHLDELEDLKGDLPSEVRALEEQLAELKEKLRTLQENVRSMYMQRDTADADIITLKEKLEKYKKQQYQVRNNKEYDALTREMDAATEAIQTLEKEMESLEAKAEIGKGDVEATQQLIAEATVQLDERRTALADVSRATADEELKYTHERQKLFVRINKADLAVYERIRKAKKGKAVVPVKRGACGGCFNRVPPQKLLELRKNDRFHTCERCGRILVSDEIAETKLTVA